MTGLELLQAMIEGGSPPPPVAGLVGFSLEEVGEGTAVFVLEPVEEHLNPLGTMHGGIHATLLDSAMGCAVHTTLAAGETYTTLELKVNYLRPAFPGGETLRAEGRVLHRGATVALAEARLVGAQTGKLIAHGTSTCLIRAALRT